MCVYIYIYIYVDACVYVCMRSLSLSIYIYIYIHVSHLSILDDEAKGWASSWPNCTTAEVDAITRAGASPCGVPEASPLELLWACSPIQAGITAPFKGMMWELCNIILGTRDVFRSYICYHLLSWQCSPFSRAPQPQSL